MKRQQQGITSIPSTSGRDLNEILTETKVNSALSWAFIPPELLDSIMGFLDKKDVTWFKNMRLVNLHWNSAANSMMERCRHRVLRTFKPFHGGFWYMDQIYNGRYRQLFIPTVKMSPYNQNSDAVKEIERAINKKLQIGGAENEIESRTGYPKSLYLCPEVEGVNWSRILELEEMSEPLLYVPDVPLVSIDTQSEIEFPVTWTFGKHLTSLILHGIEYSPEQLQKILKNASQLQVLEIFKTIVVTKNNEDFEEKWPLPTISSLTTLLVKKNCGGVGVIVNNYFSIQMGKVSKYQITRWLIKPYSTIDQLTNLEFNNARHVDPWQNKKLEQLKIYNLESLPIEPSRATGPLRLSILDVEHNKIALQEFLSFIQQFSKNLEHLYLNLDLNDFKDVELDETGGREMRLTRKARLPKFPINDVVFRNLKEFALPFKVIESYWPVTEYLLRKFPNLEIVHIVSKRRDCTRYNSYMLRKEHVIWSVCPNLKRICLYEDEITGDCGKLVARETAIQTDYDEFCSNPELTNFTLNIPRPKSLYV